MAERERKLCPYDRSTLSSLYDVLIRFAGAGGMEDERMQFVEVAANWDYHFPFEYRFQGVLGFGGKLRFPEDKDPYVDCYLEDLDTQRRRVITKTNKELSETMKLLKG